jgi:hypothetical protein
MVKLRYKIFQLMQREFLRNARPPPPMTFSPLLGAYGVMMDPHPRREEAKETGAKARAPSGRPRGLRWQDRRSLGDLGSAGGKAGIVKTAWNVRL